MGSPVGVQEGLIVGSDVGLSVVGSEVGLGAVAVGPSVGRDVGSSVGNGRRVGWVEGNSLGFAVGPGVSVNVTSVFDFAVGSSVDSDGDRGVGSEVNEMPVSTFEVGLRVGSGVGSGVGMNVFVGSASICTVGV